MHIPDGVMSPIVLAMGWIFSIPFIALAFRKVDLNSDTSKLPRLAVVSAGIFIAQMLNFPIVGGTSGHMLGAALAFIILGRWGAIISLTLVIILQALMFGDGGILALGLNLLNMPVIGVGVSELVIMNIAKGRLGKEGLPLAVFTAGWCSSVVGAIAVAMQLGSSFAMTGGAFGVPAVVSFPSMLGAHALIGIGEGLICGGVVAYLLKVAPKNIKGHAQKTKKVRSKDRSYVPAVKAIVAMILVFSIGLMFFYLFVADKPDALEVTLSDWGAVERVYYTAPLNYGENYNQTLLLGIFGGLFILMVAWAVSDIHRKRKEKEENDCSTQD